VKVKKGNHEVIISCCQAIVRSYVTRALYVQSPLLRFACYFYDSSYLENIEEKNYRKPPKFNYNIYQGYSVLIYFAKSDEYVKIYYAYIFHLNCLMLYTSWINLILKSKNQQIHTTFFSH